MCSLSCIFLLLLSRLFDSMLRILSVFLESCLFLIKHSTFSFFRCRLGASCPVLLFLKSLAISLVQFIYFFTSTSSCRFSLLLVAGKWLWSGSYSHTVASSDFIVSCVVKCCSDLAMLPEVGTE